MSRPVVYRVLHALWVPLHQAEKNLRNEADDLRASCNDCACEDCQAARVECQQAIATLEASADDLRSRWLPYEMNVPQEDRLLAGAVDAFLHGGGVRVDGIAEGFESLSLASRVRSVGLELYTRYAASGLSDDLQLSLILDHFSE